MNENKNITYESKKTVLLSKSIIISLLVFILCMAISSWVTSLQQNKEINYNRELILSKLDKVRSSLSLKLYSIINLSQGLINLVKIQGGISQKQFNDMANELINQEPDIRNIALAPDNKIEYMFPIKGNEKALGMNYLQTPGQRETVIRAMNEKVTIVAGPLELVQGGVGLISRTPIYINDSIKLKKGKSYWGIASVVINFDKFIKVSGLDKNDNLLNLALRGTDGLGERGRCFWGDSTIFIKNPVIMDISLPLGNWQIAAAPYKGWKETKFFSHWYFHVGFVLSVVVAFLFFQIFKKNDKLKYEIGEHRKTEIILRNTNQYNRRLIEGNLDPLITMTSEGIITDVNQAAEAATGMCKNMLLGSKFSDYFTQPEKAEVVCKEVITSGALRGYPLIFKNSDGIFSNVLINATTYICEDGKTPGILVTARDISKLIEAENTVKESQKRYKFLADNLVDVVWVFDVETMKFNYISPSVELLRGYTPEEAMNQPIQDVFSSSSLEFFNIIINQIKEPDYNLDFSKFLINEIEQPRKDGSFVWTEVITRLFRNEKTNHLEIYGVSRDITERKKAESERLRLQNLESLGILAGGIAHDFNNILAVVLGRVSLAIDMEKEPSIKNSLLIVQKAISRATSLTHQLLTFSRGGIPQKVLINLRKLLNDTVKFALSGSNVVEEIINNETYNLEADPGQISQVIQNIVINAEQAMPEGGTLLIRTNDFIDDNENKFVNISISDTGIGIPKENLNKIFDPYFTTKKMGNGLGLSVCHSIIKKHGGYIYVRSTIGKGTIFEIFLPATEMPVIEIYKKRKKPSRKMKILIMDDEKEIRDTLVALLVNDGHEVLEAAEGKEAIRKYEEEFIKGAPFDLVIMDLTIKGGMGGKEAVANLHNLYPLAKVIVSSGYASDLIENYKKYGFIDSLKKPYSILDVDEVLFRVCEL